MKNLKQETKDVISKDALSGTGMPKAGWKARFIAGSALAISGCGSVDVENMVPMPSKRDSSADFRTEGMPKADAPLDFRKADARSDIRLPDLRFDSKSADGMAAKDGPKDASKWDGKSLDAKGPDKGAADACVAESKPLGCSNSSTLISQWLSLGQTMDLKSSAPFMPTVYRLRFEGVDISGGTTSAIVSMYDSCGKVLKKDKIASGTSKSLFMNGQQVNVTAEQVNGGITIADGSLQNGWAKITVAVPCNLDMGTPDFKTKPSDSKLPADTKHQADTVPKADSAKKADSKVSSDSLTKADTKPADLKISADVAKKDSAKPDGAIPDSASLKEGPAPKFDASKKDSWNPDGQKADSKTTCASSPAETAAKYLFMGTPYIVGGYTFIYQGFGGSVVVLFDIKCGSAYIVSSQACPMGKTTIINVPSDGKKISLMPNAANTIGIDVIISVENV